jgi:hypothetical protein
MEVSIEGGVRQMSCDISTSVLALVRNELLRLARFEDALAAAEAEAVPYWASYPGSVQVHRMAAVALRADAEAALAGFGRDVPPLEAERQRSADVSSNG